MRTKVLLSAIAAAPLVLVAAATATASPPDSASSSVDRPTARKASGWTKVSTGSVDSLSEVTVQRTTDGVLHAVYAQDLVTSDSYEHSTISTGGAVTGHSDVLGPWATLVGNPKLLTSASGGLRLVFSGLQDGNSNNFYSVGFAYDTTSDASGSSWALQPHALTKSGVAYTGYGVGATTLSNGTPLTAATLNEDIYYRVGDIPTTDILAVYAQPNDLRYSTASCCLNATQLVNSGDAVWMAWYASGSSEATNGTFVQQIYPSPGAVLKAPGSSVGDSSLNPDQSVAMVARPGGGVALAYKMGYPTTKAIGLWEVGTASATKVKGSKGADHIALSAGATGRMWLAWSNENDDVYALRTSPTGFGLGAPQALDSPAKSSQIWNIAVDASLDQGTVLVNDTASTSVFARMVSPGLTLKVKPGKLKVGKSKKVTFTVTDAGVRVAGVKVKGGGKSCTTKASGKCTAKLKPSKPGKVIIKAKKKGYGAARATVKAKK